ncbi:hypothetical protein [Streptomyces sp. NPDC052721]|uniref:hypothetical protein n=1 Tax=Streptomyces sp. NPDC052721 TaxID=3154955 RepID=UPI00343FCDB5
MNFHGKDMSAAGDRAEEERAERRPARRPATGGRRSLAVRAAVLLPVAALTAVAALTVHSAGHTGTDRTSVRAVDPVDDWNSTGS